MNEKYSDGLVIAIILWLIIFLPESKRSWNETMTDLANKFTYNSNTGGWEENDLYSLPGIKNIIILQF
jgi:hypothetical protein